MARLMDHVTGKVQALLHECQTLRKARMDPYRKDVQFSPGDTLHSVEQVPLGRVTSEREKH